MIRFPERSAAASALLPAAPERPSVAKAELYAPALAPRDRMRDPAMMKRWSRLGNVMRFLACESRRTRNNKDGWVRLPDLRVKENELRWLVAGDGGKPLDTHPQADEVGRRIGNAYQEDGCHALVHTGDQVYERGISHPEDPKLHSLFLDRLSAVDRIHGTLGNHDHDSSGEYGDPDAFAAASRAMAGRPLVQPSRAWDITWHTNTFSVHEIHLDSTYIHNDPKQLDVLRDVIDSSTADYRVVVMHHPPVSYGSHGHNEAASKLVMPILEGRVDLVLAGHEHDQQDNMTRNGTTVLVTGSASDSRETGKGGELQRWSSRRWGFLRLNFSSDGIDIQFRKAAGGKAGKEMHRRFQARGNRGDLGLDEPSARRMLARRSRDAHRAAL